MLFAEQIEKFQKLSRRQKLLAGSLAAVLFFSLYFNIFYKPLSRSITRSKLQVQKSASRLNELKTKFPQITKQKQNIHSLNSECKSLLAQIAEIEKSLPHERNASQLLTEISRAAKDLKLLSMRQKTGTGEEYRRIFVELKFSAPYGKVINYIRRSEAITPFLVTEELDVSEPKSDKEEGPQARLVLSTLLGNISTSELIKLKEEKDIEVARDIFVSKARPADKVSKVELKLEGITYSPEGSTAIINGDVVKTGSQIGNLMVKEIVNDEVILTDGIEDHILSVTH